MQKRRKIVLIGAGSAVFTQGLVADFILAQDLGNWEIALVDIDKKTLDSITMLTRRMVTTKQADIIISSSMDRREVLPGADVVVATIAVGGRRAWEADVLIPRKYGIYQPVGDTTMPGGISRALRMIPTMLEITKDIQELCPEAYFFNYSNPMSAICSAIRKETDIPVVGLCHGMIFVEQYLARFIGKNPAQAKSLSVGLNHLTFMYDFRVNGENAWPLVDNELRNQKGDKKLVLPGNSGFAEMDGEDQDHPKYIDNPFSWSIYERYGVFPAVLDRHVTEFFPERFPNGLYFGKTLGIDAFTFEGTIASGDQIYAEMHEQAAGVRPMNEKLFQRASGEHEQLLEILKSLYTDERKLFYVNLPNNGAVPDLPHDAILELPAAATGNGFYPLFIPKIPELPAAILRRRIAVVDLTVQAAVKGDRDLFVEALLADGAVRDEESAEKLADELLDIHRPYLSQFYKS
jgi:alpha-galactosidase